MRLDWEGSLHLPSRVRGEMPVSASLLEPFSDMADRFSAWPRGTRGQDWEFDLTRNRASYTCDTRHKTKFRVS